MRVAWALQWLHVMCTATLTFGAIHAKRGRDALAAIGLLASFRGILVHDHWAACGVYDCQHASCNARHLRELIAMAETYPELPWPKRLIALLCEANEATRLALTQAANVSGCFRSEDGAHAFATIRSYLSTLHNQSVDPYQALVMTFRGNPPMSRLA